jgi:hypothetical protein
MKCSRMKTIANWDAYKEVQNDLWTDDVHDLVHRCFSSLPKPDCLNEPSEDSSVSQVSKIDISGIADFAHLYIVDFNDHTDEKDDFAESNLLRFVNRDHLIAYEEIRRWTTTPSVNYVAHTEQDFPSRLIRHPSEPGVYLCGRRGSGKSSLIAYNMERYKLLSLYIPIKIALDKRDFTVITKEGYLAQRLIEQADSIVYDLKKQKNISTAEIILNRFAIYWKDGTAGDYWPSDGDSPENIMYKSHGRDSFISNTLSKDKYGTEFHKYLKASIHYIEHLTKMSVILIIDDIDHLEQISIAQDICTAAAELVDRIKRPLIISVREETIPRLGAKDLVGRLKRVPVLPPSFKKILQSRWEAFQTLVNNTSNLNMGSWGRSDLLHFVKHIIDSVCSQGVYSRMLCFHYDLDVLLDMIRCLLSSPFLTPSLVLDRKRSNRLIGWNLMLDTFQRYRYRNHYERLSFFLNIYDNNLEHGRPSDDADQAYAMNALVRLRLLALLVFLYLRGIPRKPVDALPSYSLEHIKNDMKQLGYHDMFITSALNAFASHRLIRTGRLRNELANDVTEISISGAVVFYYDHLISEYRYIENVLPTTPVDFTFNDNLMSGNVEVSHDQLKEIDECIDKFALFIEQCEAIEKKFVGHNPAFLKQVWAGLPMSERIRQTVKRFKESGKQKQDTN